MFVLALTAELWTLALPHRTQILFSVDIAQVVMHLSLRPGSVVVESGTGSGSLTASLARAVAPGGRVHTYEFNADRATRAAAEFAALGLAGVVAVTHADACADGFGDAVAGTADGVFLDLPQPWLALPHARRALRRCGTVCSFSPCVEQVQRTADAMRALGFDEVRAVESLLRPYDALPWVLPQPVVDWRGDGGGVDAGAAAATAAAEALGGRGPKRARADPAAPAATAAAAVGGGGDADGDDSDGGATRPGDGDGGVGADNAGGGDDGGGDDGGAGGEVEAADGGGGELALDAVGRAPAAASPAVAAAPPGRATAAAARAFVPYPSTIGTHAVSARPAPAMRGHTGFLTFATLFSK